MSQTYCDQGQFSLYTGLGVRINDESVGTGNSSTTSFDLDFDRILDGTYTISHAASGSNDFTALTDTTDYVLDKLSGRIELTSAGVTEVGDDIIYATYIYSGTDGLDSDNIDTMIAAGSDETEKSTGQFWGTSTEVIEFQDGERNKIANGNYPVTDQPFMSDWDKRDFIQLEQKPVLSVEKVYFLSRGTKFRKVFSYDLGTTTFTDITDDAVSPSEDDALLFGASPAIGDIVYFGSQNQFLGMVTNMNVVGVSSTISLDWEYYNGVALAWQDLTETETDSGSSTFKASGKFTWTEPNNWGKNTINGSEQYWVRAKITAGPYTTAPQATETAMDQDLVISSKIAISNIDISNSGKLTFLNNTIPDGTRNIRIVYNKGISSVPENIKELTALYAGLRAYANITGASYDALTSYNVGAKSVTIGEQYINVREVVTQFRQRIKEILANYGRRVRFL